MGWKEPTRQKVSDGVLECVSGRHAFAASCVRRATCVLRHGLPLEANLVDHGGIFVAEAPVKP